MKVRLEKLPFERVRTGIVRRLNALVENELARDRTLSNARGEQHLSLFKARLRARLNGNK